MQLDITTNDALNHEEVVNLIRHLGPLRTVFVEGHMGTGKTTLLKSLAELLPNHKPVYFDCTTKDLGDIMLPKISGDSDKEYSEFVPNEELGFHHDQPIILLLDELGKANMGVKPALTRVILEKAIANKCLKDGSIVFATSNLAEEGVGDNLDPHQWNRLTHVELKKPTDVEWRGWAMLNDVDPVLPSFVKEFPQVLQSFQEVANYEDNPYIFHPQAERISFVTPRSLEAASDIVKLRDVLSKRELRAALAGTIGGAATRDMMAFIELADQLPTLESIKTSPATAIVPTNASAVCMVVYKALQNIDKSWTKAWLTYFVRLPKESQALFVHGVTHKSHPQRAHIVLFKEFTEWCLENNYLYK